MLIARFVAVMFSLGLMLADAGGVRGQDYPNRTIRIITAGVGGGSDFTARLVAQGLSASLGQQVVVENRTGRLAAEAVSKAPPDGYTLMVNGVLAWVLPLMQKVPYDIVKDFSPISLVMTAPSVLVVHPSLPVKSVSELIALAKARPGELNISSASIGGSGHLAGELFKSMAGVNIVHVPYKATGMAITALISGEVQLTIFEPGLVMPHVKAGRLRALAVTSAQPSVLVPGVPTLANSGLPGYEAGAMNGIWAPAKTPEALTNRLNQEIVRFLKQQDVKDRFLNAAGAETVGNSPEQFAATIQSEIAKWDKVIKQAGIKVN